MRHFVSQDAQNFLGRPGAFEQPPIEDDETARQREGVDLFRIGYKQGETVGGISRIVEQRCGEILKRFEHLWIADKPHPTPYLSQRSLAQWLFPIERNPHGSLICHPVLHVRSPAPERPQGGEAKEHCQQGDHHQRPAKRPFMSPNE